MAKSYFPIAFFVFLHLCLRAAEPGELFRQANDAFQQKDFEAAVKLYEQVAAEGYRSPELEYNLGNAYYRLGKTGKAILHYERALVLAPGDPDAEHNLTLSMRQLKGDIEELPEFFLTRWWKNLRKLASSEFWGMLALFMWWTGLAGFVIWLLGKTRQQKKAGFVAGTLLLLLSIIPFSLSLSRMMYEKNSGHAIVLKADVSLRSAPDEASTEILPLYEGLKVKLLSKLSGWWQVRLPNGETGWLDQRKLEQI